MKLTDSNELSVLDLKEFSVTEFLRQIRISDFGRVVTGGTPSTSDSEMWGDGYPFVTPTEMDGRGLFPSAGRVVTEKARNTLRTKFCPAGSISVCCIGATIGKVVILPVASLTNQQINSIVVDETQHHFRFVYYLMRTQTARLRAVASGSATPLLNKSVFESLSVSVPSLSDQRAIAGVLGALDDKIESNRRKIAIAQGLIHAEFLSSTRNGARDGLLGDVLTELRSKVSGDAAGVVVFSALAEGRLAASDDYFTKKVYSAEIDKYLKVPQWAFAYNPSRINIGSIGLNSSMTVGAVSPVYVVAQAPTRAVARWVEQALRTGSLKDKIVAYSSGSVRQVLRYSDFAAIELRLPSDAELSKFEDDTLTLYDLIEKATQESHSITVLREALLPELLSGRLRVKDAESKMENV
jgi:type I restriction enzyme S subunit